MNSTTLPLLLAFAACALPAAAQVPGASRQVDESEQRRRAEQSARGSTDGGSAPELYGGETADLGPQTVLGIAPRRQLFEASADVQYYHTDNFFLVEEPFEQSTTVLLSTLDVALAPTPYPLAGGWFAPRVGVRQQWYNFGLETDQPFDTFDFSAQTLYAEGRVRLGQQWTLEAGFDALRLVNQDTDDEFYKELSPRWGVTWRQPLGRAATLEIGYRGVYRITETDFPMINGFDDRLDTLAHAAVSIRCGERFVAQPYYRYQFTHYTDEFFGIERDGQLHSAGLGLYYFVTDWCSIRGFIQYDSAEFNNPALPDYRNLNAGGGVNLTLRF